MAQNEEGWTEFYKWALAGSCSLVILVAGMAIGLWSRSLDRRLDDIASSQIKQWEIINERASLPPRLGEIERRTDDQEQRLRQIERKVWGGGR